MATINHSIAVGVFQDRLQAFKAIEALRRHGFGDELIGFIGKEGDTGPLQATVEETRVGSFATGAVEGGVLGGVLGAAVALLIPGVGPAIAGGIIGATLGGAALGVATGGLLGTLTGMGLSNEEARYYQSELAAGRTIVTVKAEQRYTEAQNLLQRNGARDITRNLQSSGTVTETNFQMTDVTTNVVGPAPAPDIYTPQPLPDIGEGDSEQQTNDQP